MVQLTCPDTARWQALLADAAAPDEAAELEAHLSACPRCRGLLDELAVGSSGWLRDASRLAATTDAAAGTDDPDLTRTLHRLRDGGPDGESSVPLDFLTSSDQLGILGTLGRYQVLGVLGRGACGIVLKALDPDLLRPVAIKVMAPHLAHNGTARQRFLREARAAAAVSHDHVVTIHAVEPADGLPYLVMEYVTGVSLQGRLDRDGPLAAADIARIGLQAARGLAAAHALGQVHRDIKPANMLLENGVERVKITDFGLARAADDASLTASGTAAGTPLYMSPEQARGETVDHRSDLFSLGSVLYTLATGFPPFRAGTTMGVLNRISNDPPRPIRETIPDFPATLEAIVMQLLEKSPARRFQSASEVADRLGEFLSAAPVRAKPRRGWLVAAGLALVVALIVGGVVLTFSTPKGTLVVELDDPAAKITLDGSDVVITGIGVHEVRLKTGEYRLTTTKDGKQTKQEVVTITKDGRQVVKVTFEPAPNLPSPVPVVQSLDALLADRLKTAFPDGDPARLDLMRQAWLAARSGVEPIRVASDPPIPQTHPSYRRLKESMVQAVKAEPTQAAEALKDAYGVAGTILSDTAQSAALMKARRPTQLDPAWEAKFKPLLDRFQSFPSRLGKTTVGAVANVRGHVTDLDKATNNLTEPTRGRMKKFLALRNDVALLIPRAQANASKLNDLQDAVAANARKSLEETLQTQYQTLTGLLADMDKVATELGAKPYVPPSASLAPPAEGWEARLKKRADAFKAMTKELAKAPAGRVLVTAAPLADPNSATAGLDAKDVLPAKRLLKLRDEFGLLLPRAQQELARWEKADLAARTKEEQHAAGTISKPDMETARLERKAADRALWGADDTMARILADLKTLADELKVTVPAADLLPERPKTPLPDGPEANYRKFVEEYEAVTARIKNTQRGKRFFAIADAADVRATGLKGDEADRASRLLSLVEHFGKLAPKAVPEIGQWEQRKLTADTAEILYDAGRLSRDARDAARADLADSERTLKSYEETLGGIITDLKKLADELGAPSDGPPGDGLAAEFKKVMAEFDALALRLAKTPVGRLLATLPYQPYGKGWGDKNLTDAFGADAKNIEQGRKLLTFRDQISFQASRAETSFKQRANRNEAKATRKKEDLTPNLDEEIAKHEQDVRLRTTAIRRLLDDLKKLADEIDPPKMGPGQ